MESFRKKLKLRIALCAFLLVTGVFLSIYGITLQAQTPTTEHAMSFFNGYSLGAGLGLSFAALITSILNIRYLYNKKACEEKMLVENDERNRYISLKSWAIAGYVMLYILFISTFIVGIHINVLTAQILIGMLFLFAIIRTISHAILNKIT